MTCAQQEPLLTEQTVLGHLAERRLLETGEAMVTRLSGGVSAVVYRVDTPSGSVVVKQARSLLDVPAHWPADPARSAFEAAALTVMKDLTPDMVPAVIDVDEIHHILVMEAAPPEWSPYKGLLLHGAGSPRTSALIATALGTWHARTWGSLAVETAFGRPEDLEALRTRPYFIAAAEQAPSFTPLMVRAAAILRGPGRSLVHGDATPKNVLASSSADRAWLLDAEVAHYGRPELDVAMWCSHLVLKINRPGAQATDAGDALVSFVDAYQESEARDRLENEVLATLTAAVLVARLHGMSRVDYLADIDPQDVARTALRELEPAGDVLQTLREIGVGAR
jgi:5-methylthioribose kinase